MTAGGLPAAVVLVKTCGWLQAGVFVRAANRQVHKLYKSADVTSSFVGSPDVLLAYRLCMLAWGLYIGIGQLLDKGPYVFVFYTVWNWWMLTLFFALASAASIRGWRRRRAAASGRPTDTEQQHAADWLDRAAIATFSIEAPLSLALDFLTWAVLVPMLLNSSQDPARIQFWRHRMYCFESYNQHAVNAVMMLGELLLNRIPVTFYSSGWLALWSSIYGVWSGVFYARNGRFIYPFLDAHKPYAWVSYLGLYAVHWAAFLLVMGAARAKRKLLEGQAPVAFEPAAAAAAEPVAEPKKRR